MQIKEQTFLREKDKLLGFHRNRVSSLEEARTSADVFYQFVDGYDPLIPRPGNVMAIFSARNKIIDRYRRCGPT